MAETTTPSEVIVGIDVVNIWATLSDASDSEEVPS